VKLHQFLAAPNFSLLKRKHNEKVAEEFCWAITYTTVCSCYRRPCYSVLQFGFGLDLLSLTVCMPDSDLRTIRFAQGTPGRQDCSSRGVPVLSWCVCI
jgi:hypothetical protein